MRPSQRQPDQLRPVRLTRNFGDARASIDLRRRSGDLGNSISLRTGQNSQPNLSMRLFNCS